MRPSGGSVYLRRMAELTVYEKPTCTTCRKLAALLTERGIDFERVNYTSSRSTMPPTTR